MIQALYMNAMVSSIMEEEKGCLEALEGLKPEENARRLDG